MTILALFSKQTDRQTDRQTHRHTDTHVQTINSLRALQHYMRMYLMYRHTTILQHYIENYVGAYVYMCVCLDYVFMHTCMHTY